MGTLSINFLGTSFTIQANEDSEYLTKLLGYYKRIAEQIKESGILKNPTQIAIMTGLMLCDELYKEKSKKLIQANGQEYYETEDDAEAERRTLEMIEKISAVIDNDETAEEENSDDENLY